jgi:crotonobetainyl-CoA:carnitine CoA-transferase CaiB-like acyl-CoA transferase
MLPLKGTTVVALEQAVAAPFATRQLADLGARVIKIERPGSGDFARAYDGTVNGLSSHFVWLNRSKESLSLDVKHPAAAEVLRRLLGASDVFIHNLAPGAVDRLGFGTAGLRAAHPRLIVCQVTGYGTTGPDCQRKAYDLLVQSETGLLSITGTAETPSKVGISVADIAAGMYAYSGVLTALLARGASGQGTAIEVSLLDALGEWMGFPLYYATYGGVEPPRAGPSHAAIAPYGPYAAGDDKTVYLAVQNDREWTRFCDAVLGAPELATDPRFATNTSRVAHRAALDAIVAERFGPLSSDALLARLDGAGIANARLNTVREFAAHPQLSARGRWRAVDSPVGPIRALVPPVIMDGVEPVMRAIPEVGEHTDAILAELGVEPRTIAAWRREGIV